MEQMKAVYMEEHGDLDKLKFGDLPVPTVGPNDVLIKLEYAGLNHLDIFVRKGWPGLKLKFPHIFGSDGSGTVVQVGEMVSQVKEGDQVTFNPGVSCGTCEDCLRGEHSLCHKFYIIGENRNGTYAQYVRVPAVNVIKVPSDIDMKVAAAAPLNFLTAWRMLITKAKIKPNDYVLVVGAGGGVSTAAIQIAKLFNAKVIATSSTPEKLEKAREIGADYVINYREVEDWEKVVYVDITEKRGVDIAVDSVGTATFAKSLRTLRKGGKLVTCGATTGPKTDLLINLVFWKQLEILGSTMSSQSEFRDVMKLVFARKLRPVIDKVFPLEEAQEAQARMEKGQQFGKILLEIKQD